VLKDIARFKEILGSEQLVLGIIKNELDILKGEFGDERRTEILTDTRELTIEDMIAEEDMVVTITNTGYIKRNPITLYQSQRRGGKGKTAMGTKERGFRFPPVCGFHPSLFSLFHQSGQSILVQGLWHSPGRPPEQGQGHRQPVGFRRW
jgi:DNA gyrase/topoisomerase IV subunit A